MIIKYDPVKWRRYPCYYSKSTFIGGIGHKTTKSTAYLGIENNRLPRLPMFPNMLIERTWIEYFRAIHRVLEEHIEDTQVHKVK